MTTNQPKPLQGKEHKHELVDKGLGYFVTGGIFMHDPDSMTSATHEFECECGYKEYTEDFL